jgi:sulfonate transport system substrate-binding protein
MKRSFILYLAVIVMLAAGCGSAATGTGPAAKPELQKPEKIHLGYSTSLTSELIIVAKQKGWFEEEFKKDGIEVEFKRFMNGPPIIEALNGGRLDFGQAGDQPSIQANANNVDVKVVGIFSTNLDSRLIVPIDSTINGITDLKDKKVAVSVGSNHHKSLLYFLKFYGLTDKDIQLVNLDYANIRTAITNKTIDAAVLGQPNIAILETDGLGRVIDHKTDIKPSNSAILVNRGFAEKYPDIVNRVLKLYAKSQKFIAENRQEAYQLVAQDSGLKVAIVEKAVRFNHYDLRITDETKRAFKATEQFLRENKLTKRDVNIDELLDTRYLEAIGLQKK